MTIARSIRQCTHDLRTPATLEAFRDHGCLRASLGEGIPEARQVIEALESTGISLRDVTDRLLEDGVRTFILAFDTLLAALNAARQGTRNPRRE